MKWSPSRLSAIYWNAAPQQGVRLRFVHRRRRVPIPVAYPNFSSPGGNTKMIPLRCSLHFYPRQGRYRSYRSLIQRVVPAKLVAVTRYFLIFQPDPVLAQEYPCPKLLRRFKRFVARSLRSQKVTARVRRLAPAAALQRARRTPYALWLQTSQSNNRLPLRRLAQRLRRCTVVLTIKRSTSTTVLIQHPHPSKKP